MAKKEAAETVEVIEKAAVTYTKEQLYNSKRYAERKDVLMVVLEESKEYTLAEVDELIEKFMYRKVD